MSRYLIVAIILLIVVFGFLLIRNRNKEPEIDSYKNTRNILKGTPNRTMTPVPNIDELDMEVNNGGFNQYFFNSSGQNCFETLRELKKVGKYRKAELLQKAIDLINPQQLSEGALIQKLRNRQVDQLNDVEVNIQLDSLDQVYFKNPE